MTRVVLFRASHQQEPLKTQLEEASFEVLSIPLLEFKPIPNYLSESKLPAISTTCETKPWRSLIFTSPNAVAFATAHLTITNQQLISIGPATSRALRKAGYEPHLEAKTTSSEGLLDALPQNLRDQSYLIPVNKHHRDILRPELEQRGALVEVVPVYEAVMPTLDPSITLQSGDICLFSSGQMIEHFYKSFLAQYHELRFVVLGERLAMLLRSYGQEPDVILESLDGVAASLKSRCKG